uniref:C2H2-type domain-containing protein n=1 Tax=Steinernema glaseri TaxID=37863 RepID=A0A1I7YVU0_9BILA
MEAEQRAELQKQLDEIKQKAMACELKYFPPSSLVSFAETSGRNTVNLACKKCGKICVELRARRDHVGVHLKKKIQCPLRGCLGCLGCMRSIKDHLTSKHGRTLAMLTEEERDRLEESKRKFYKDVDAAMGDYFPELLQTKERSPFCKNYSGNVATMFNHLHNKHGKILQKLTEKQRGRYEESRRKFHEQVDAVMHKYFS